MNPIAINPVYLLLGLAAFIAVNAGVWYWLHNRYQQQLLALCQYDQTTGLANQQAIDCQLKHEWQRMQRGGNEFAIVGLYIDGLGKLLAHLPANETQALLKAIGSRLQSLSREVDSLAHTGSGNFVALLPQSHLEGARTAAERLRLQFKETPLQVGNREHHLTARFGIAVARQGDLALTDAMGRMQQALELAKRQAIDSVCVEGA